MDGEILSDFSPGQTNYTLASAHKLNIEAEASEPGAQVEIVTSENSTFIKVTATDGKSELEYKIDWEIEPEKPEYAMDVKTIFTNKKGEVINQLSPNDTITAEIEVTNTKNKNQDIIVVMELLNEKNEVVDVTHASRTIPKNQTKEMSTKIKLPSNIEGYKLKLTTWEGKKIKENMIPLSDEVIITE